MPSTLGQWLIVILALLVGLLGGWLFASRRSATGPVESIVEGDPAAGVADVPAPTTAVVDQAHPAAVVDEAPTPAAVTDEPAPAGYEAPPAAATLAANATPLTAADEPTPVEEPAAAEPVHVEEPVAAEPTSAEEPVAAEQPVAAEPAAVEEPVSIGEPATVGGAEPVVPAEQPAAEAGESAAPAVVPAPRSAVEDTFPVATTPAAAPEAVPAADAAAGTNGSEPADDFRRIQGIGPKLAAALQAAGIRTYRQLGDLDEAALRDTVRAAGLRAAASLATWPQQARVLAGARAEADQVLPTGAGEDA